MNRGTRRVKNACVVGSGPNGLTAAIMLARAGLPTVVFEAEPSIGGGARSAEFTRPGFVHDVCSAVHPLAVSSPVFSTFPLSEHGLRWIQPPYPVAHPFDNGSAVALSRDVESTCERLGADGGAYRRAIVPFVNRWPELSDEILRPIHIPKNPWLLARFGVYAMMPAKIGARLLFRTEAARALISGIAAHSVLPLENYGSAAFACVLAAAAHAVGWPVPSGGSQRIADALASYLGSLGGRIVSGNRIHSLRELDSFELILCDVTPRQFLELAGARLPDRFSRQMRTYRYGPGVFKVDWALSGVIPWKAVECAGAGTIHIGGSSGDIAAAERAAIVNGSVVDRPFLILTQPSLFDPTRAPNGGHTAWAYCHVPNGSAADMTERIETQVERFAPGFRSRIIARHTSAPADLERHNANLIGGDISGGSNDLKQLIFRPTRMLYRTPLEGVYLCSSSTPPGGGVHGMCGYHAARTALGDAGIQFRQVSSHRA